jgi:nanoRNase/pAp phosphatase (c-di-AMP/oligoRNAs hydrolase)
MNGDPKPDLPKVGNKKVKAKVEQFVELVRSNAGKEFIVCSHNNPDPDSLASGFAMLRILSFLGVETIGLYYCGEISHPQNRAMQNVLDIPFKKWTQEIETRLSSKLDDVVVIFVDCAGTSQKNMSVPFKPQVAIDHHKATADRDVLFIHDEVGACATLLVDLMLNMPPNVIEDKQYFCFDHEVDGAKDLFTALAIGLKTDTIDFISENTTEQDYRAFRILSRYFSYDQFNKIVNYELPPYVFDYEEIAWKNRSATAPNLISGLGFVEQSKSDCIPYLADKMMRLQGIQTVVIYAIVEDSIRASVRTSSAAHDCQTLVEEIFGVGNGGAKRGIGGAAVALGPFNIGEMDEQEKEKLWDLTKSHIERKFAAVVQK